MSQPAPPRHLADEQGAILAGHLDTTAATDIVDGHLTALAP